jgi:phosphate transport system ATP-binding protein
MTGSPLLETSHLSANFGETAAFRDISLSFAPHTVTAIIGPSGCGKSTFIRCINRLHEETPGATVTGHVRLAGEDIYATAVDPVSLRRRVGMVFQKPNPFPALSIFEASGNPAKTIPSGGGRKQLTSLGPLG